MEMLSVSLQIIDESSFANAKNLKLFFGNFNNIKSFPSGMFPSTMEHISINSNLIDVLSSSSFDGLINLIELHLADNHIQQLPPNIFMVLSALKVLDLSDNQIAVLDADIFDELTHLQLLMMARNKLKSLQPDTLKKLLNLVEIDLS
ncbi:unnamed protein product, partial [Diamesa hyperborea]